MRDENSGKVIRFNNNDNSVFSTLVKEHFKYLFELGFRVTSERYDPEFFGNAQIVFESAEVGIDIVVDRGQVLISLGPISNRRWDWFEFASVVRRLAPNVDLVYLREARPNEKIDLEEQVKWLANLMHQYCGLVLQGDFSFAKKHSG